LDAQIDAMGEDAGGGRGDDEDDFRMDAEEERALAGMDL
jgi:hypothetical protein